MQAAEIIQTDNGYLIAYTHMEHGKTIIDEELAHWTKEQYAEYRKRAEERRIKINRENSK